MQAINDISDAIFLAVNRPLRMMDRDSDARQEEARSDEEPAVDASDVATSAVSRYLSTQRPTRTVSPQPSGGLANTDRTDEMRAVIGSSVYRYMRDETDRAAAAANRSVGEPATERERSSVVRSSVGNYIDQRMESTDEADSSRPAAGGRSAQRGGLRSAINDYIDTAARERAAESAATEPPGDTSAAPHAALAESVTTLTESVEDMGSRLDTLDERTAEIAATQARQGRQLRDLGEAIDTVSVSPEIDHVAQAVSELDAALSSLDERMRGVVGLENTIDELGDEIATVHDELGQLRNRVDSLADQADDHPAGTGQLTELTAAIESLEEAHAEQSLAIRDELAELRDRVVAVEDSSMDPDRVLEMVVTLSQLGGTADRAPDPAEMAGRIQRISDRLDRMNADVNSDRTTNAD